MLKSKPSKLTCQMQILKYKSFMFIDYLKSPIDTTSIFIKDDWNRIFYYGDAGYAELKFSIYRTSKLPIESHIQNYLIESFQNLEKLMKTAPMILQSWT